MSIISGVKSSPAKLGHSRKGEKPPRFGVKTEQEGELATVSGAKTLKLCKVNREEKEGLAAYGMAQWVSCAYL